MQRWEQMLERRSRPRRRGRLPCELRVDGRPHPGRVVDLSADGLFVQTEAQLPTGFPVEVRLQLPDGRPAELVATLAHRRVVARSLAAVARDGIGLRIRNASESYTSWLARHDALPRRVPSSAPIELVDVVE